MRATGDYKRFYAILMLLMRKRFIVILMSMSVLICLGLVKPLYAATNFFGSSTFTQLYLDRGFLNRPVDLDLPAINLNIAFTQNDIPDPGVLTIITEASNNKASNKGNEIIGDTVRLHWQTNAPNKPDSAMFTIYTESCAGLENLECAFEQTVQGKTELVKAKEISSEKVSARVKLNSSINLVYIPKTEPESQDPGYMTEGVASWYAYKGCNCAASPDFPKGSYVKVTRTNEPSKSVVVRINDYGPERDIFPDRVIDLDKVAFMRIAPLGAGLTHVKVEPVDDPPTPAPTPVQPSDPAPIVADLGWEY